MRKNLSVFGGINYKMYTRNVSLKYLTYLPINHLNHVLLLLGLSRNAYSDLAFSV